MGSSSLLLAECRLRLEAINAGLIRFCEAIDKDEPIEVGLGGVIVPGVGAFADFHPGKEYETHEPRSEREAAGSAAGPWSGPRPSPTETAAGSSAHTVGHLTSTLSDRFGGWRGSGVTEQEIEGLAVYYPDAALTASSSRYAYLMLHANPFPALGAGFKMMYEIPHPRTVIAVGDHYKMNVNSAWTRVTGDADPATVLMVPAIRAWARWQGGPLHGAPVVSHHQMPDMSMCVCLPHQWIRGPHLLIDFVSMSVLWTAKLLHERFVGSYPGRQHYAALARRQRDRRWEFCGCGADKRYDACHRADDTCTPLEELSLEHDLGRRQYLKQLYRECRPVKPPPRAWCVP